MLDTNSSSRLSLSVAVLTIAGVVAVAYGSVLSQSWLYDDAFHLVYISGHSPGEYFTTPASWRELPFRMYTPLQMASFEADLAVGGYKPGVFYVHSLVLLVIAAWLVFATLRRFIGDARSLLLAIAFLLGPAIGEWGRILMARHYLEGFCFAAAAFYVATRFNVGAGFRRPTPARDGLAKASPYVYVAALLYFIAMLFKEVFVLLPVFVLLLPGRRRARAMIAFGVALIAYLALRFYMLGTLGGGYGWAVRPADYPAVIAAMPSKLWSVMTGSEWTIAAAVFIAVIVIALSPLRVHIWRLLVAAVLAMLPVIPVATTVERRYAGLLWVVCCVTIAIASAVFSRRNALVFVAVLVAAIGVGRYRDWNRWNARIARMSAESNAFLRLGSGDVLAMPVTPPAAIASLKNLKENVLRQGAAPRWFYDPVVVCEQSSVANGSVWTVDATTVSRTNPAREWSSFCSSIRPGPMTAHFTREGDALFWSLEPGEGVAWTFILGDAQQAFEMPAEGGFQIGAADEVNLRLRYRANNGAVVYSPPLHLDFRNSRSFDWRQ